MWAKFYAVFGRVSGHRIRVYPPEEVAAYLNEHSLKSFETGVRTRWTNGLTVIVVISLAKH